MSSPRLRRLASDYRDVREEFSGHPYITVTPVGALPPEKYHIEFRVPGLVLNGNQPVFSQAHQVELTLPMGYPREQPYCIPLTPVFHPNIGGQQYCLADFWFAGETLVDTIRKIGDIIQFRLYNTDSPLNGDAQLWALQNPHLFPLAGSVDLGVADIEVNIGQANGSGAEPVALAAGDHGSPPVDGGQPVAGTASDGDPSEGGGNDRAGEQTGHQDTESEGTD